MNKKNFFTIILSLSLIFLNFMCSNTIMGKQQTQPYNSTAKAFLALGDSYTIGESVSTQERFAAQTVLFLKKSGIKINEPEYIATTGWTTIDLMNAIALKKPSSNYDIVTLLIGVNDQYQGMDANGYKMRFTQLLKKAVELAKGNAKNVFVLSIPDYSVTPFAQNSDTEKISNEIDAFNAINKTVTEAFNITYIDITASTREAKNDMSLIAADGLHPSVKEYTKWALLLATEIKKRLQ